jgi:adhesin/invasin
VIDTLAVVSYASPQEFHGSWGGQPVDGLPAVVVTTPTQRPMQGIAVTFAITDGGSSLTGGNATTDASGIATVGSWTLRDVNVMSATASSTAGTGFLGNPRVFRAYDRQD